MSSKISSLISVFVELSIKHTKKVLINTYEVVLHCSVTRAFPET